MSISEDSKEFTFIWKIENFSMLPHQHGESLTSPEFVVDLWERIKWHLALYPKGEVEEDYVSCYLYATASEMNDFKVIFHLTLESTDPTKEITRKAVYQIKNHSWGWKNFRSLTEIHARKDFFLPQDILSIRCHFRPIHYKEQTNEIECTTNFLKKVHISRTGFQAQQRSITWSIQNISTRRERVEKLFVMKDSPCLKVTLNLEDITNSICVPIEIQQTAPVPLDEKRERLFVKCRITVVNVGEVYQDSKESTHLFKLELDDVWHFPLFLKTTNLTCDKYLNQKDTLFIQCEFVFSYKNGVYHWDESYGPFAFGSRKKDKTSNWCKSIQNLCVSGKFSDVRLIAGGQTFPAHKLVLCARSSVFCAMFENDMKKDISGVVEIKDVDPLTLKRMLTHINFDDIKEKDISLEDVCKLYAAADKYNVESLKRWCTRSLVSSLSVESVGDVLSGSC